MKELTCGHWDRARILTVSLWGFAAHHGAFGSPRWFSPVPSSRISPLWWPWLLHLLQRITESNNDDEPYSWRTQIINGVFVQQWILSTHFRSYSSRASKQRDVEQKARLSQYSPWSVFTIGSKYSRRLCLCCSWLSRLFDVCIYHVVEANELKRLQQKNLFALIFIIDINYNNYFSVLLVKKYTWNYTVLNTHFSPSSNHCGRLQRGKALIGIMRPSGHLLVPLADHVTRGFHRCRCDRAQPATCRRTFVVEKFSSLWVADPTVFFWLSISGGRRYRILHWDQW